MIFLKNNKTLYLLVVAVLLLTVFIIFNSIIDRETSYSSTEKIVDVIVSKKEEVYVTIGIIIRKLAHIVEFAALGAVLMSCGVFIRKQYGKSFYGFALFYALAVAVADEHIQSFSDRTSSTEDIIIDFVGALIGFFIVYAMLSVTKKTRKRRHIKTN